MLVAGNSVDWKGRRLNFTNVNTFILAFPTCSFSMSQPYLNSSVDRKTALALNFPYKNDAHPWHKGFTRRRQLLPSPALWRVQASEPPGICHSILAGAFLCNCFLFFKRPRAQLTNAILNVVHLLKVSVVELQDSLRTLNSIT